MDSEEHAAVSRLAWLLCLVYALAAVHTPHATAVVVTLFDGRLLLDRARTQLQRGIAPPLRCSIKTAASTCIPLRMYCGQMAAGPSDGSSAGEPSPTGAARGCAYSSSEVYQAPALSERGPPSRASKETRLSGGKSEQLWGRNAGKKPAFLPRNEGKYILKGQSCNSRIYLIR